MPNLGTLDRTIRLVLGAVLGLAPFLTPLSLWTAGWTVWVSVILGLVLVATAVVSFCPIYAGLGLSTKPHSEGSAK